MSGVSLGAHLAVRMGIGDMIQYWIAQVAGAIVAAVVLLMIASVLPVMRAVARIRGFARFSLESEQS